jgi:hypothetical protein
MAMYRIYFVGTAKPKPGKSGAAAKWWHEKGMAFYESLPGVKSVHAYASQFDLGDTYGFEIWTEIENYAVMDRWDEDAAANPQKYGPLLGEFNDLFESGPSRLMGDWPESHLVSTD